MEAKLIKKNDIFYLYVDESWSIASTDVKDNRDKKLSLKNCQAIANGYDLENMADFYGAKAKGSLDFKLGANKGFEDGFQKAIEILVNEKFNRQDIIHALTYGVREAKNGRTHSQILEEYRNTHLIQQTEWDVEIVTTKRMENGKSGLYVPIIKPKLDADGCLILSQKLSIFATE